MNQILMPRVVLCRSFISRLLAAMFALIAVFWCSAPSAHASTWLGTSSSNWSLTGNWTGGTPAAAGQAYFNAASTNMNVNLDVAASLGPSNGIGGLLFGQNAFSGSQGYTLGGIATLTGGNWMWVEIEPSFQGSNITETVGVNLALVGAQNKSIGLFANMTLPSASYQAGTWNTTGLVTTGTNNLLLISSTSITASGVNASPLYFVGPGNGQITGNILSGATTLTTINMVMDGQGTWTLSGSNSFGAAATTVVQAGTLALDFSGANASTVAGGSNTRISSLGVLTLGGNVGASVANGNTGGTLAMLGNGSATSFQGVASTTLGAGSNVVSVVSGSNQNATIALGAITQNKGAGLDIELNSVGTSGSAAVTTTTVNVNNIMGVGYATYGQQYWAKSGAAGTNPITGLTSDDGLTFGATKNVTISAPTALSTGTSANTLRFDSANNLSLGSNALTLTAGGILVTKNVASPITISGGSLSSSAATTGVAINQFSTSPVTISSSITGTYPLVKNGPGTLILSGNNTFNAYSTNTGGVYLNSGKIVAGSATALGSGSNQLTMGYSATYDLNGFNSTVVGLSSDSGGAAIGALNGAQAAAMGLNANVTNSAPGTVSTLTVGNQPTPITVATTYLGGFTEQPGAILGLSFIGSGNQGWGTYYGSTIGGYQSSNSLDQNGLRAWSNTITGGVSIGAGASLGISGGSFFNMMGPLVLNGYLSNPGKSPAINTTYLAGSGVIASGGGGGASVSVNPLGSVPIVSGVRFGQGQQLVGAIGSVFDGTGAISMPMIGYGSSFATGVMGGTVTVNTPGFLEFSNSQNAVMYMLGEQTLKLTGAGGTASSPTPVFLGIGTRISGGTVAFAPQGSGQNVFVNDNVVNGCTLNGHYLFGGGATLLLDAGSNTSLTMTSNQFNPATTTQVFQRAYVGAQGGTVTIASAQGLSALGSTDKFNIFSYAPSSAIPTTNAGGIVMPWIVGQDASVATGLTRPGTFLTYNYSGSSSTADAGFVPVSYSAAATNPTSLAAPANTAPGTLVALINSGTQTVVANQTITALQIDNYGTTTGGIVVNAPANLTINNGGQNGLILNGGSITGSGVLSNGGQELLIYTSLANGTIGTGIQGGGIVSKFGPGILTLTGTNNTYSGSTIIDGGVLDVGKVSGNLGTSGALMLRGGVLQASGTYTSALGTSSNNVGWSMVNDNSAGGGGFSAKGGSLLVALGGIASPTPLNWGGSYASATVNGAYFLGEGGVLNFGSTNSDNVVTFANNINLGVTESDSSYGGYSRVVSVTGNSGDAALEPQSVADYTILSGTISNSSIVMPHILSKTGNGVLVLSASNTYSAGTSIAAGALLINADANLGAAPTAPYAFNVTAGINGGAITPGAVVIDSGATLGSGTAATALTISANRSILLASGSGSTPSNISVYAGNTLTIGGLIGDYLGEVGNLGKTGGGTLILSGSQNNPFTGGLTIVNGTVQDASPNNTAVLGSGNVTFGTSNTPTLDLNGRNVATGLLSGAGANGLVTTTSNAVVTLSLAGSGTQTYAGAINNGSGTVVLNMAGGTQILTGANGFKGAVTLSGGTLQASNAALNASDLTNGIVFNGGALRAAAGGISTAKAVTMTGAGTFDTNGQNSTLSGNIVGAGGALSKAGTGTLVLSGLNNTFSGGLTVNNGTVQAGSGAGTAVLGSGNVSFGTANTPTVDLNGNSATVGLLSGAGTNGVVKTSVAGPVTLTLAGSGSQAFGGNVQDGAGTVSLTVNSGAQILTGVSSYSGETSVYGGSLTVTGTGAIAASVGLSIGGNGAFNFVTGTTGQVLTVQNLTTPYDSGTSTFGVEVGNSINVTNSPSGYRTLAVNLFGVLGTNPDPGHTGTPITVLTAPDSLDNYAAYVLGNVYGATNFTVTGTPASNNPSTGFGNTVSVQITGANQLAAAYWKGSFGAANNVWAISNGSTAGNWTTDGNTATPLVPGAATDVTISGTASAGQEGNMSLGAAMAVNSLTVSDTNAVLLQDAFNSLTVSGTKGIAVNAGSATVNLNAGLVLNGTASQALTANNATGLLVSGVISSGANGITVNGTNVVTLAGNNTFTGPVTVSAGTLKLAGSNAFTGALTLSGASLLNTTTAGINGADTTNGITFGTGGATLQAATGGINTAKSVTLSGAATFDTNGNNITVSGIISGAGGVVTKNGLGILTLGGSNTFSTGVTINNGTVRLSTSGTGVLGGGTLTFASTNTPTLDLNDNSATVNGFSDGGVSGHNGIITNNALDSGTGTLTINIASGAVLEYTSIQDGPNGAKVALVKTGNGTLQIGGIGDSFSGGITVASGTLQGFGDKNQGGYTLGTGPITFGTSNTPTFDVNTTNGSVTSGLLAGSSTNGTVLNGANTNLTLTLNGYGAQTYGGVITNGTAGGSVALTIANNNAGAQSLTGSNTYTGATTIGGGLLSIGSDSNLGGSAGTVSVLSSTSGNATVQVALSGGVLPVGFGINSALLGSTVKTIVMASGSATITLNTTAASTIPTGAGTAVSFATDTPLTFANNGTLQATNSFSMVQSDTSTGVSAYNATLARGVVMTAQMEGLIDVTGTNNLTIPGIISGVAPTATLIKTDTGTLTLTGSNTYNGFWGLNGGILNATTASLNSVLMAGIDFSGGTLQVSSTGTITTGTGAKPIVLTMASPSAGTVDTNGVVSGTAVLFTGVVSGPGGLVKTGLGTMQLTAANTFLGGLTINQGTVLGGTSAVAGVFGPGTVTFGTANSPTLDLNGQSATTGLLSGSGTNGVITSGIAGTPTLTISGTTTQTYAGLISNGGATSVSLFKTGTGTQILTGTANSFTGTITVNGGVLNANTAAINGSSVTNGITLNSGTLQSGAGGIDSSKAVNMNTGVGTFDTNGNDSFLRGAITGGGPFVKAGAGTLTLTNAASTFYGGITITGGTLAGAGTSGANSALGVGTGSITFNGTGAALLATGTISRTGAITLTSAGIIDTQAYPVTDSGLVSGAGSLIKNGSGSLTLSASNSFTGGMVINNGTVKPTIAGALGAGNITFGNSNTPTLDLAGSGQTVPGLLIGSANAVVINSSTSNSAGLILTGTGVGTFNGVLQDALSVSGSGAVLGITGSSTGTQILGGVSIYKGSTVEAGGKLIVSGSLMGTSSVTVQNVGTLGGAGLINAPVTVAATGGTIAPGNVDGSNNSTVGTLSVGSLDLSGGALNAHLSMQLGGVAAGASDQVNASGSVNVTGADLLLSLISGYAPAPGDTLFLVINGTSETGNFATINGIAGSYGQDSVVTIGVTNFTISYNASFNGGVGSLFDNPGIGNDIALMVAVPEPGTWALLVGGIGMLGLWQRRRSKI